MAGRIGARLEAAGIELPAAPAPQGNYVPYVVSGNLVFLSGQVALVEGELKLSGVVGQDLSIEEGQQSARLCAINLIAQLKAACGGDLDRVVRCVKLGGFVPCPAGFTDQPQVIIGASDLLGAVFGDHGRHARCAVGAPAPPLRAACEAAALFALP